MINKQRRAVIIEDEVFFGNVIFETKKHEVVKLNDDTIASMNKEDVKEVIPEFNDIEEKSYGSYVILDK